MPLIALKTSSPMLRSKDCLAPASSSLNSSTFSRYLFPNKFPIQLTSGSSHLQVHGRRTEYSFGRMFAKIVTNLHDKLQHTLDRSLRLRPFVELLDALLHDEKGIQLLNELDCFVAAFLLFLAALTYISTQSLKLRPKTALLPQSTISKLWLLHR
jgi:hypothetical protein